MSLFKNMLKSMNNEYAKSAAEGIAAGEITDYYDTGSYVFNALLSGSIYGGLPNNGITQLAGEPSTGKTFFALSISKNFLDKNPSGEVFYFETESALPVETLKNRGIDTNRFNIIAVPTVEEFRTQAVAATNVYSEALKNAKSGDTVPPVLFILDSVGGLSTMKEITDIEEGDNKRDMTRAQLLRGAFRVITLKMGLAKIPMLLINHVYDVVGAYVPTQKAGGGKGPEFSSSTIAFLSKKMDRDDKTKKITGALISATIQKGRLTLERSKVETLLNFATGLDRYHGLSTLALEFGIFKKSGNYVELPDGNKAFQSHIDADPEKYFTKDILDAIDVKCQETFKYGGVKKKTPEPTKKSLKKEDVKNA